MVYNISASASSGIEFFWSEKLEATHSELQESDFDFLNGVI